MRQQTNQLYEFGRFRLEAGERLLRRDGESVPLTPKAFDLLLALVAQHGHLLEKEELLRLVWPDTIVEESNLTSNIALLRKTLGEGENGQKYIETVPRRGYRFSAAVREVQEERAKDESSPPASVESPADVQFPPPTSSPAKQVRRWTRLTFILALGVLGLTSSVGIWMIAFRRPTELSPPRITPFTTFPGRELTPAFSPDGNSIAFSWAGDKDDNREIYIKQIGTENLFRLTTNPAQDINPCWSPDGRHIAFLRKSAGSDTLFLVPSLGGTERRITDMFPFPWGTTVSWSPDGQWLAVCDKSSPQEPFSIFKVARETGKKQVLTAPPATTLGDAYPAISPDGKTVVFCRNLGVRAGDLYLISAAGGEAQQLTFDQANASFPIWTPDGRYILFLSDRGGGSAQTLWKVPATGGTPEPIEAVGRFIPFVAISRQGNRLAWTQFILDQNIWQLDLTGAAAPVGAKPAPQPLISSTVRDLHPQFSPDGNKIVFTSDRSGSFEIWVCDRDGQHLDQLTFFGRSIVSLPRWSPDGQQIVFNATAEGSPDIYVINATGGKLRRLTTETSEDIEPSWSRDGQWIYFCSNRSGSQQLWKLPLAGGQAVQITRQGGVDAVESHDSQYLYYTKGQGVPGIWRLPMGGGEETLILDHKRAEFWPNWALVEKGIYFTTAEQNEQWLIKFFSFATGEVKLVTTLEKSVMGGSHNLSVSSDGRRLIWSQVDQSGCDIMLMENFR